MIEYKNGEKNFPKSRVEVAGYVSRSRRIETLINAGARLEQLQAQGQYDYREGQDPEKVKIRIPVTRRRDFDLADLSDQVDKGHEALSKISAKISKKPGKDTGTPDKTPPEPNGEEVKA